MTVRLVPAFLAALALPPALGAQQPAPADTARLEFVALPAGSLVRVHTTRAATRGGRDTRLARVEWMREDSLRVRWVRLVDARTLAWTEVAGLDTLGGREGRGRNVGIGTAAGAITGVAVGIFFGALVGTLCEFDNCPSELGLVGITAMPTLLGAGLGATLGSAVPGPLRWRAVGTLPPSRRRATTARDSATTSRAESRVPDGTIVRARRTGEHESLAARLRWSDGDSLSLDRAPRAAPVTLAWRDLARLDTLGRRRDDGRNVVYGLVIGSVVGGLAVYHGYRGFGLRLDAQTAAIGGVLVGAVPGVLIGATIPPRRGWCRVLPTPSRSCGR